MTKRLLKDLTFIFLFLFLINPYGKSLNALTDPWNQSTSRKSESLKTENSNEIRIGLLLPAQPRDDLLARSAFQGAELAIRQANRDGGYNGRPFKLITRIADGLWGAGSKESVSFVHEDQVLAIVTSVDGRNAHLVEQVVAKSQVVQLATRATEETLSQAYIPWFFRIVPNDVQQAEALIEEIFNKQGCTEVHLIYEEGYDHYSAARSFIKEIEKKGFALSGKSVYLPSENEDFDTGLKENTEAVIVFGSFENARLIIDRIKLDIPSVKVFGTLAMTSDGLIGSEYADGCEGGTFISSKFCFTTPGQAFKDTYLKKYNQMPNPAASYAYDGINLIIEAVHMAGPDSKRIRDVLKGINYTRGVTGLIRFDENGNRINPVFFVRIIKGHPVLLNP
jgi:branched-chain amino acid transport system substrate-binding protein